MRQISLSGFELWGPRGKHASAWPRTARSHALRGSVLVRRSAVLLGLVLGLAWTVPAQTLACTTPVYRYAMYNWPPAPYFIFYFHPGEIPGEDVKVNEAITKLAEEGPPFGNVLLEPVDVSKDEVEKLPKPVQDAWREHVGEKTEGAEPVHLVFTSWGARLYAGRLDEAAVKAMVESPLRTKIGKLLQDGCAAVMVFLPGTKEAENKQAEEVAKDLVARAGAGQVPIESAMFDPSLYPRPPSAQGPGGEGSEEDGEEAPTEEELLAAASRLKLGLVTVDRSQKAEKWLFDSLMAVEPDLKELADEPMIFFAYGRGRAMPPYVGKGINAENLTAEVQFLASACSCFVKDQNPGVDLLMCWDWDATADAMAANDPTLSGGPFAYGEFYPDESGNMVSSEEEAEPSTEVALRDEAPSGETAAEEDADVPPTEAEATEGMNDSPTTEASPDAAREGDPSSEAKGSEAPVEPARVVTPRAEETATGGSFASRQIWTFGLGLAAVALVVLVAGSMLILKR